MTKVLCALLLFLNAYIGGCHTWPGGNTYFPKITGRISYDINACREIWNFFKEGF